MNLNPTRIHTCVWAILFHLFPVLQTTLMNYILLTYLSSGISTIICDKWVGGAGGRLFHLQFFAKF